MKRNLFTFLGLLLFTTAFWWGALSTYFAQDDFILISEFSQNQILDDIKTAVGPPVVTHFRPLHNLFFLISGNFFGQNYFLYHMFTILIFSISGFGIYKVLFKITANQFASFLTSMLYVAHSAHFVSMYWISGGATMIGFTFLIYSYYFLLQKKILLSVLSFFCSVLSSEAMVVGLAGYFALQIFLGKRSIKSLAHLKYFVVLAVVFIFVRILFLTPAPTFEAYHITFEKKLIEGFVYYLSRLPGFSESGNDLLPTLLLLFWLGVLLLFIAKPLLERNKLILLGTFFALLGLLPFVLIENHFSAHYLNISIFGLCVLFCAAILKKSKVVSFLFLFSYVLISFYNVKLLENNSWVILRSKESAELINKIKEDDPVDGSLLIFSGDDSEEAYIALGTGKAINFWFRNKHYTTCFTFFQDCPIENGVKIL